MQPPGARRAAVRLPRALSCAGVQEGRQAAGCERSSTPLSEACLCKAATAGCRSGRPFPAYRPACSRKALGHLVVAGHVGNVAQHLLCGAGEQRGERGFRARVVARVEHGARHKQASVPPTATQVEALWSHWHTDQSPVPACFKPDSSPTHAESGSRRRHSPPRRAPT